MKISITFSVLASDKIRKLKCKLLHINLNRHKWDVILHDVIYVVCYILDITLYDNIISNLNSP